MRHILMASGFLVGLVVIFFAKSVRADISSQVAPLLSLTNILAVDPVDEYWTNRAKYFLLIDADKYWQTNANLPFAKADGEQIATMFTHFGYRELGNFEGTNVILDDILSRLEEVSKKQSNALVVIYYIGHGCVDEGGQNLWLQVYDQKYIGANHGLSLSQLVTTARGVNYDIELGIIVDACFSGAGALTPALNLHQIRNTSILASSSYCQESFELDGTNMSAFTYSLLQGLSEGWGDVDRDQGGIITLNDLAIYVTTLLEQDYRSKRIPSQMRPSYTSTATSMFISYDPARVKNHNSLLRRSVVVASIEAALGFKDETGGIQAIIRNEWAVPPAHAAELAALIPNDSDSYALGLKALAESKFDDARKFLSKAENEKAANSQQISVALAKTEFYAGQPEPAMEWYLRTVQQEIVASKEKPRYFFQRGHYSDPAVAMNFANLAEIYKANNQYTLAETYYRRAITVATDTSGPSNPVVVPFLKGFATLLRDPNKPRLDKFNTDDLTLARSLEQKANAIEYHISTIDRAPAGQDFLFPKNETNQDENPAATRPTMVPSF